jgi:hypothetical protein
MHDSELKAFIRQHSNLFWYTPQDQKEDVSDELLVETILNYGTLDDFKDMTKIMGLHTISGIFLGMEGRKKMNYYPEVYNFFYLYFKSHV